MSREDNAMFYQAIGNSIQENKDKIEKLEKQNGRLKKKNKKLKEEIKGYQTMYFDKVMIINEIENILNNQMGYREFVDIVNAIEDVIKEVV